MLSRQSGLFGLFSGLTLALAACDAHGEEDYDPLRFVTQGTQLIATGEIDSRSPQAFTKALQMAPDTKMLVLQYVPGSLDDEANLKLARAVRDSGLATFVPKDGLVASGGTDLFLAGVTRTAVAGACLGVHSWSGGPDFPLATDLPHDDEEHEKYLIYYNAMGIPEAFYWFTLKAAPAEGMHWMSAAEINTYQMTTEPMAAAVRSTRRCEERS
ncbi:alpha/beta hydrolase [Aliiroseovarius lamellibrachiae]|uniref:COG3904 family protein n=1 Tax=Aliiroseovarius lamellibrachiae TaxID=1924933 RepID=UPI001BE0DBCD|nr:alpha/beta hydrolase [Aliiroseovarius lamellibrachiae]MBT2129846.1 alpha/beta hydrolase [Aliiroseovarius lamellibrachiae]